MPLIGTETLLPLISGLAALYKLHSRMVEDEFFEEPNWEFDVLDSAWFSDVPIVPDFQFFKCPGYRPPAAGTWDVMYSLMNL